MIPRVSQDTDELVALVAHDKQASTSPAIVAHLSYMDLGLALRQVVRHDLLLLPSPHAAQHRMTSPLSQTLRGTGRGRAPPSTPTLTRIDTLAQSTRTKGTTILEQAPSMHHATHKTGPPSGDDRYDEPPSKCCPTGQAYGPTYYGMGLTTTALTFKANQANEGHDPRARDRGHRLHDQQDNQ
jgi:hypothetical protein